MNDAGLAQQLGGHACPRHAAHLCRHFPHRLRRLSAASSRSRWKAALVDRRCWFSATGAKFWKMNPLLAAAGPGGAADTQEPSAEGSRPARMVLTTALTFIAKDVVPLSHNSQSVPLREQPPQRGPRLFTVERYLPCAQPVRGPETGAAFVFRVLCAVPLSVLCTL